jgi:hypothetical protein
MIIIILLIHHQDIIIIIIIIIIFIIIIYWWFIVIIIIIIISYRLFTYHVDWEHMIVFFNCSDRRFARAKLDPAIRQHPKVTQSLIAAGARSRWSSGITRGAGKILVKSHEYSIKYPVFNNNRCNWGCFFGFND